MQEKQKEIEEKITTIKNLCQLILDLLKDERKAIHDDQWQKLDALIRRKSHLLETLESVGFENLNELYIFDKRVLAIRDLVQTIVNKESDNAHLLRTRMQAVKENINKVKCALQSAVYSQSQILGSSLVERY